MTEETICGVHVSQGSAETLLTRGGITNHYIIAFSISNISVKNYQNQLLCIKVIASYISVVFWTPSVYSATIYTIFLLHIKSQH